MRVTLEGASLCYETSPGERTRALEDVSLEFAGGVTGVMGETGSGKSTLLEVLAGALVPDAGCLLVDGADASRGQGAHRLASSVGLVFQIPERQFFEATVEKELTFGLLARGHGAREARERAKHQREMVEDVVDSGHSLRFLLDLLADRGARSVRIATLVNKTERREVDIPVAFSGFMLDSGFIVGYGLDHAERYRALPSIYELLSV